MIAGICVLVLAGIVALAYRVQHREAELEPSIAPTANAAAAGPTKGGDAAATGLPLAGNPPPLADVLFRTAHGALVSVDGHLLAPGELVHVRPGKLHYRVHCPGRPSTPIRSRSLPSPRKCRTFS